jgi:hypothetical protein
MTISFQRRPSRYSAYSPSIQDGRVSRHRKILVILQASAWPVPAPPARTPALPRDRVAKLLAARQR